MTNKGLIRLVAVIIAISMPLMTAISAVAETEYKTDVKYESPDINDLSGLGEEPEDLSVTAGAEYLEKAWYEYVMYSENAVASYRLSDDMRLLFYDPYTYTNSMVMDVEFDAATTSFDTMSTYTVSKTNTKSISACVSSTETNTDAVQTSGRDQTYTEVDNSGYTKTIYNHNIEDETSGTKKEYTDYKYKKYKTTDDSTTTIDTLNLTATGASETGLKIKVGTGVGSEIDEVIKVGTERTDNSGTEKTTSNNESWLTDKTTNTTEYSSDYKTTTKYTGYDKVEDHTESETTGWTELSARVTKTLGSSRSTSTSWSEEESVTVTKTYAATHFASDGVTPLPWAIVHYEVQMPMKCVMQVKYSGEWITISTTYCMLTTVKGTCRAWMQNGQVYYEDWGSGEPVVADDFWAQFMTVEQLMNAYSNKLYPVGGVD